jgi:hypothetical protein
MPKMLVVRVTENVRAVQSSYYSSCPWIDTPSHGPDVAKGLSSLLSPYLSISSLSNKTCILSVNIRSFNKNYSQFKDLVMRCPGILAIAVQETWGITGARMLPGFQPLVARTRTDKGGGVSVFSCVLEPHSHRMTRSLFKDFLKLCL